MELGKWLKRGRWRKWGCLTAVLALLSAAMLTGCQAVGGVDLNKALLSNLSLTSAERDGSMSIHLDYAPGYKPSNQRQAELMKLFQDTTIDLDSIKMENRQTESIQGKVQIENYAIPFSLFLQNGKVIMKVDGVNRPFVFGIGAAGTGTSAAARMLQDQQSLKSYEDVQLKLANVLGGYLLKHLPNPQNVNVTDATVEIQGQSVMLHKVHAVIGGDEVLGLVKNAMQSILDDPDGLKQMLGSLYDMMEPILLQNAANAKSSNSSASGMQSLLSDKTLAVEYLYDLVQQYLKQGIQSLNTLNQAKASAGGLFTSGSKLNVDLFVDDKGEIRKSDMALDVALTAPAGGITGIHVTSSSEDWNLNGDVKADSLDDSNAIQVNAMKNPVAVLRDVDKGSALYKLLVDELQITHKELHLALNKNEYKGNSAYMPYTINGTTMVPVRYVSENLNAKVGWDAGTHSVTIVDLVSGKTIVMTQGSKIATVDGSKATMDAAVQQRNDLEFVPLRFIAESLGGKVSWDSRTQSVTVIRN